MENNGSSLPDALIPYCRELLDRFQVDIKQDPKKRDAIIWIADLLRSEQGPAHKVLEAREKRIVISKAVTTIASKEVVDLTLESDGDDFEVLAPTSRPMPAATATPVEAFATKASPQKAKSTSQPTGSLRPAPAAPRRRGFQPCVGDWKCAFCKRWQKKFHVKCRSHQPGDKDAPCQGTRSVKSDVLCVQEDDGQHPYRKMGKYKGDW